MASRWGLVAVAVSALTCAAGCATTPVKPEVQARVHEQVNALAAWARDPVVLAAVRAQNTRGPIASLDQEEWAGLSSGDLAVRAYQTSTVGQWLIRQVHASGGAVSEAVLVAARGELVSFTIKPARYRFNGLPQVDVPLTGRNWQGPPETDPITKARHVWIAVPVFDVGQRPMGVLMAQLSLPALGER